MKDKAEGTPAACVPRGKDPRILDCDACGEPLAAHEGAALWFRSAGDIVRVNVRCLQKGYERHRARAETAEKALANLVDGFAHVRSCRECGESDVSQCDAPMAAHALRAWETARGLVSSNASAPKAPTDSLLQVPLTTQETNPGAATRNTSSPEER